MSTPAPKTFISYAAKDCDFALRLAHDLDVRGVITWLDQRDIQPGQDWDREVSSALNSASNFIVIFSPDAVTSERVRHEISLAVHQSKTIIPVLHRDVNTPHPLPFYLTEKPVDLQADYHKGLAALLEVLNSTAGRTLQPPAPISAPPQVPPPAPKPAPPAASPAPPDDFAESLADFEWQRLRGNIRLLDLTDEEFAKALSSSYIKRPNDEVPSHETVIEPPDEPPPPPLTTYPEPPAPRLPKSTPVLRPPIQFKDFDDLTHDDSPLPQWVDPPEVSMKYRKRDWRMPRVGKIIANRFASAFSRRTKPAQATYNFDVPEIEPVLLSELSRLPDAAPPVNEKVHFTLATPPQVKPGEIFIVDCWAHLELQRSEVERRIHNAYPETDQAPLIRSKGPFHISRGSTLFVRLNFPTLRSAPAEDIILWEGEIANASFTVAVPDNIPFSPIVGNISVHAENGLQIAGLPFALLVAPTSHQAALSTHTLNPIHKAFASYASEDRNEVLGRIQGMQKIAPDLEVFLDVLTLRSGEDWEKRLWETIPQSDIFYLFWSAAAQQSAWVEKEWRCALKSRGAAFINPVPLVDPHLVRPPKELSNKHFYDWTLAFQRPKPTPAMPPPIS